jgi:DNA mismatch repair protein MutL
VVVQDLFFNTPARKAFLKSETSERRAVAQTVTAVALAHPEVGFQLHADDTVVLDLPTASDLETRALGVFGASVVERMRRFEGEANGLRVAGLASLPTYTRGNRTGQFFYVNRRPIFDKGMAHAVSAAYREVVPGGRFPVVLLFLDVMPARVDVNVHPTKAEVRFRDEGAIHEVIRHALQDALSLRHEPAAPEVRMAAGESTPEARVLARIEETAGDLFMGGSGRDLSGPEWGGARSGPGLFDAQHTGERAGRFVPEGAPVDPGLSGDPTSAGPEALPLFWQLHNTFILTQIRGALVIVDQHNSHERILYNEGRKALDGRGAASQQLLFPATLELTPAELASYEVHRGDLERVGFLTEPFGGNTVLVRGIPAEIRNWNDGALLRDILADLGEAGHTGTDPREAILASYSCHGAIRAGEKLTLPEMRSLMDRLFATELPYSCPHGRPTLIRIGLGELERRFGRR